MDLMYRRICRMNIRQGRLFCMRKTGSGRQKKVNIII